MEHFLPSSTVEVNVHITPLCHPPDSTRCVIAEMRYFSLEPLVGQIVLIVSDLKPMHESLVIILRLSKKSSLCSLARDR